MLLVIRINIKQRKLRPIRKTLNELRASKDVEYKSPADKSAILRGGLTKVGKFIEDLNPENTKETEYLWQAASAFWPAEVQWSALETLFNKIMAKERGTA